MVITFSRLGISTGHGANPARGQMNRENRFGNGNIESQHQIFDTIGPWAFVA